MVVAVRVAGGEGVDTLCDQLVLLTGPAVSIARSGEGMADGTINAVAAGDVAQPEQPEQADVGGETSADEKVSTRQLTQGSRGPGERLKTVT